VVAAAIVVYGHGVISNSYPSLGIFDVWMMHSVL
jgi:hypothetical protein